MSEPVTLACFCFGRSLVTVNTLPSSEPSVSSSQQPAKWQIMRENIHQSGLPHCEPNAQHLIPLTLRFRFWNHSVAVVTNSGKRRGVRGFPAHDGADWLVRNERFHRRVGVRWRCRDVRFIQPALPVRVGKARVEVRLVPIWSSLVPRFGRWRAELGVRRGACCTR